MITTDNILQINIVVDKERVADSLLAMNVPEEDVDMVMAYLENVGQENFVIERDDKKQLDSVATIIASAVLPEKDEEHKADPINALKKKILDSVDEIFPDE